MISLIALLALWGVTYAAICCYRDGGAPIWLSLFLVMVFGNAVLVAAHLWSSV